MSLKKMVEKIEHRFGKAKAGRRKEMKKMRNRRLRRTPKELIPNQKEYFGWEF